MPCSMIVTTYLPIKQLDHLIIRTDDPDAVFAFFSETLQLPIAWPLRTYPTFTSGGVTVGNLYLEIISTGSYPRAAQFVAIAYEANSLEDCVKELKSRGISQGPVVPYVEIGADGSKTKLYANAILGRLIGRDFWIDTMIRMGKVPGSSTMANPGAGGAMVKWGMDKVFRGKLVFLVEYSYGNFKDLPHWSEFRSHDEKRAADKARLDERLGGALGITSAKELIVGVKDIATARKLWKKFLDSEAEPFEIADGPAVRLVEVKESGIQTLVLTVASRERAEEVLRNTQMLGDVDANYLGIAPEKVFGLDVRLEQG